jgi:hypothetical protein
MGCHDMEKSATMAAHTLSLTGFTKTSQRRTFQSLHHHRQYASCVRRIEANAGASFMLTLHMHTAVLRIALLCSVPTRRGD